ncbi:unnamed protein product [Parascedosporium putredinis]|uniref:NADP-dependent oxidoreductase domain-containing protein n=1 Tax=Parascedosporium putredinis TaxID=1442378 RepID=A0A9P1H0I2_9PEZI|nr:unnamed protein product [Parascedosporium putredinis]CAI7993951.1 unnamed protein product [Parascedosporium putredinis]
MLNIFGNSTGIEPRWMPEPRERGTYSILSTCLITLGLCVWTAIHLNIPAHDEKWWHQTWRKFGWMMLGFVAPEMVAFAAYQQFMTARDITREMKKLTDQPNCDPENPIHEQPQPTSIRPGKETQDTTGSANGGHIQHEWTRVHSYFIEDKSKGSMLAKSLVCFQAAWFCIQCLTRFGQKLPVSLLELNTLGHAICTLLIYCMWWEKPLDIGQAEAIRVSGSDLERLVAAMCDTSEVEMIVQTDAFHRRREIKIPIKRTDKGPVVDLRDVCAAYRKLCTRLYKGLVKFIDSGAPCIDIAQPDIWRWSAALKASVQPPALTLFPRIRNFPRMKDPLNQWPLLRAGENLPVVSGHPSGLTSTHAGNAHVSDERAFGAMKAAIDTGCTVWNGGIFYGTPENNSLTLARKYFEKYPEDAAKVELNIKACVVPGKLEPDGSREGVLRDVEQAVSQLPPDVKVIDLFEPARVDAKVPIEETVLALKECQDKGLIKGIALSEPSAESIRKASKVVKILAVEVEIGLFTTDAMKNGVTDACAELGIPIHAYGTLGHGFLGGTIRAASDLGEGDFRRLLPRFHPENFATNLELVDSVKAVADRKGCTVSQVAISWVASLSETPGMPKIIPIPGATTAERVRENAKLIDLSKEDLDEINSILARCEVKGDRYPAPLLKYVNV